MRRKEPTALGRTCKTHTERLESNILLHTTIILYHPRCQGNISLLLLYMLMCSQVRGLAWIRRIQIIRTRQGWFGIIQKVHKIRSITKAMRPDFYLHLWVHIYTEEHRKYLMASSIVSTWESAFQRWGDLRGQNISNYLNLWWANWTKLLIKPHRFMKITLPSY